MAEHFTQRDSLNHNGFQIEKAIRKAQPADLPEADISDLLIKENGKTLLKIEGDYYPLGNALDFGLFEFFGDGGKQLAVSSTIPRGGSHYLVSLSQKPEMLFDSRIWKVGREDFGAVDIDGDGKYEILVESSLFYGFENFSSAETPLTAIYFSFDEKRRKFLPANHKFPDYSLKDIGKSKARMNKRKGTSNLARVLEITLKYIYAGKEKDAWNFFEQEYQNSDAQSLKARIKGILADEPVYKYVKAEVH